MPSVRPNSTTRLVAQQPVRFSLLIGIAAFLGAFGVTRSFPGAVVVGLAAGLSLALAWIPQNGPCQVWTRSSDGFTKAVLAGFILPTAAVFAALAWASAR